TKIGVVGDGPVISALGQTGALDFERLSDIDSAVRKVSNGDLPAMVAEQGNTITVRYAASNQVQAGMVNGIVSGVVGQDSQALIFIGIGLLPVFGLKLTGTWWMAIPVFLLGILAFFSIGMLVGAFAKTEQAASAAANIVVLPMAFLSGTFFPIDQAPAWLRT